MSEFIAEIFEKVKEQDAFQKVRENAAALDAIFNQFTNKIASLKFYEGNKIKSFN